LLELATVKEALDDLAEGQAGIQAAIGDFHSHVIDTGCRMPASCMSRGVDSRVQSRASAEEAFECDSHEYHEYEDAGNGIGLTNGLSNQAVPTDLCEPQARKSNGVTNGSLSNGVTNGETTSEDHPSDQVKNSFGKYQSRTMADLEHQSYATITAAKELRRILEVNELERSRTRQCELVTRQRMGEYGHSFRSLRNCLETCEGLKTEFFVTLELIFDSAIGGIILLNAVFLGLSMDSPNANTGGWLIIEIIFGLLFWMELLTKLYVHGWREQFLGGKDSMSNTFDACLILVDTIQLVFTLFFSELSEEMNAGPSASLFRVVRLVRLARILRLLQSQVFTDLLAMIQGMKGGMATLGWSLILFVLFTYVVSLIFRESLGPEASRKEDEISLVQRYFETVPRSMFTIFRCSFGDCSTTGGTPLFEHVTEAHGWAWSLILSGFLFVVAIGLFNVISAIFVESTLASAAEMAANKKRMRLQNERRWAVNVAALIRCLLRESGEEEDVEATDSEGIIEPRISAEYLDRVLNTEFPSDLIDSVVKDKEAVKALNNLDIDPHDHAYLSDIIDPDCSGTVGVLELVDGLKRLRGDPRRSDIVTVDLVVRSLQEKVSDMQEKVCEIWHTIHHENLVPRTQADEPCRDPRHQPVVQGSNSHRGINGASRKLS
jgi:hypothetical protein